jgi:hypothetical protein
MWVNSGARPVIIASGFVQVGSARLDRREEESTLKTNTSTKRNLTKGAFTLKFYAFYAFKVYTNSPEFHLVLTYGEHR